MDKLELFLSLETSESAHIGDRAHVRIPGIHAQNTMRLNGACGGNNVQASTLYKLSTAVVLRDGGGSLLNNRPCQCNTSVCLATQWFAWPRIYNLLRVHKVCWRYQGSSLQPVTVNAQFTTTPAS